MGDKRIGEKNAVKIVDLVFEYDRLWDENDVAYFPDTPEYENCIYRNRILYNLYHTAINGLPVDGVIGSDALTLIAGRLQRLGNRKGYKAGNTFEQFAQKLKPEQVNRLLVIMSQTRDRSEGLFEDAVSRYLQINRIGMMSILSGRRNYFWWFWIR